MSKALDIQTQFAIRLGSSSGSRKCDALLVLWHCIARMQPHFKLLPYSPRLVRHPLSGVPKVLEVFHMMFRQV